MSYPNDLPLKWMHDIQFKKLSTAKNVAKTHWLKMKPIDLLDKLRDEVDELALAIEINPPIPDEIIDECADIANFAAMIAHRIDHG